MSKILKYEKGYASAYIEQSDEIEEYAEIVEYEVDDEQLLEALVEAVFEDYFRTNSDIYGYVSRTLSVKKGIRDFINDYGLIDELYDNYEDYIRDYFKGEVFDEN